MRRNTFIFSTTNLLEGYKITSYHDICSERIVIGAGFFSEFFAGFTDVFGGRSAKFEGRLNELNEIAMAKIGRKARSLGANALIGIKTDIDEISGKGYQMFMMSITGTAVTVSAIKEKTIVSDEKVLETDNYSDNSMEGYLIKERFLKSKYIRELSQCKDLAKKNEILKEMVNEYILLPLNVVIHSTIENISSENLENTGYLEYLLLYEQTELSDALNHYIKQYQGESKLFYELYGEFALPDYETTAEILEKIPPDSLINVLKVFSKYKKEYNLQDAENIKQVIQGLERILVREDVKIVKGLTGSSWVCLCGTKNKYDVCSNNNCCREKNQLTSDESNQIKSIIATLNELAQIISDNVK